MTLSDSDKDWALRAFNTYPEITSYGFSPAPPGCIDNWENGLDESKIWQIIKARNFLETLTRTENVSFSSPCSSQVRNLMGDYVYHGAVILAAKALLIPTSRIGSTPYARLGISKKAVKAMLK